MTTEVKCVRTAALAILAQCVGLLDEIDDRCYAADSETIRGGTIGKHVRHSLDHFEAALHGHERGEEIDYDHRARAVPMETERAPAIIAIGSLRDRIEGLTGADLGTSIRVRVMLSGEGAEASLDSTLGRELFFATHHAMHHHAMIKAIAREHGYEPGDDFGRAPSTINFERSNA